MIVINKKRIQIVTSCILIGVLAFSFKIANTQKQTEQNIEKSNTMETTSTPVSGKTVVVDARTRCAR